MFFGQGSVADRMSTLKQLARAWVPDALKPHARRLARAAGLLPPAREPPFSYPFYDLMLAAPSFKAAYRWGAYSAALLAKTLKYERISLIEFGVAGGNGLVALERAALDAEQRSGVRIDVYGFDTGAGLPKPRDYRDLPNLWREGDYKMDVGKLQARLTRAKLVLGPIAETMPDFIASQPAPVGFAAFDVDLYSSTRDAFQLFRADSKTHLPRVVCYFDDISAWSYSDFTGERAAIADFNRDDPLRKLSPIYNLWILLGAKPWTALMYMFHAFDHPRYCDWDGSNTIPELPLLDS